MTPVTTAGKIARGLEGATNLLEPDDALLERHRAFWRMEPAKEAILRVSPYVPLGKGGHVGGYLAHVREGDLIEPERLRLGDPADLMPSSSRDGPLLREAQLPGVCWTEGFLGCPVRMETGGPWAERFLHGPEAVRRRCRDGRAGARQAWLLKFREGTRALIQSAAGRFPLAQSLLRGPLDMMAAALGHEAMATAFLDFPEDAHAFLGLCTELFIELAREHMGLVPPFHGGFAVFNLWSPVPAVRTQLDNAVLLSPTLYQESFLPHETRVFREFPAVVIHVHSGCLHIVDQLLGAPDLTAIQVSIDFPGGPLARDILDTLLRIQGRKPLIVTGGVTDEELELLRRSLPPAGVAMDLQLARDGGAGRGSTCRGSWSRRP